MFISMGPHVIDGSRPESHGPIGLRLERHRCTVLFAIGFLAFARFLPFPSPGKRPPRWRLTSPTTGPASHRRIFMIIGFACSRRRLRGRAGTTPD